MLPPIIHPKFQMRITHSIQPCEEVTGLTPIPQKIQFNSFNPRKNWTVSSLTLQKKKGKNGDLKNNR